MDNGKVTKIGKQEVKVPKTTESTNNTRMPFRFFVTSCRTELNKTLVANRPSRQEFYQLCSSRWKSMSNSERKPFELMANDKMKRREQRGRKKQSKLRTMCSKKAPGPKKPLSSFLWYCWDERPKVMKEYPNLKMTEVAETLGYFWASCSPDIKDRYEALASKDKIRYQKEKLEYEHNKKSNKEHGQQIENQEAAKIVGEGECQTNSQN